MPDRLVKYIKKLEQTISRIRSKLSASSIYSTCTKYDSAMFGLTPSSFHGGLLTYLVLFLGMIMLWREFLSVSEINVLALISTVLDHAPPQKINEKKGPTFQLSSVGHTQTQKLLNTS